jgi:Cu/Ag efflux protein CusF
MKKVVSIIVALLFVFSITSLSFAVEGQKTMPAEKPKVKQVTGDVKSVDMNAKTLTVVKMMKGKTEETVVTVDDKTKIRMGKEKKTLADVKVGDKVIAKYIEVDGKNLAKVVAIKPPVKKTESAKPM